MARGCRGALCSAGGGWIVRVVRSTRRFASDSYTDQRWEFIFPGGQSTYFWIYHRPSNRCLSLKGVETGTPQNGYDAQMEPCEWAGATNGRGDDSVWSYYGSLYYRSRLGGRCLEWDTNYARYGQVQVWNCQAQPNAQWMVNEWG